MVDKYAMENLVEEDNVMNIMEKLVDFTLFDGGVEGVEDVAVGEEVDGEAMRALLRVHEDEVNELSAIAALAPTADQARVLNQLKDAKCGVHVISGGPGTGKTFITKQLLHHYRQQGRKTVSEGRSGTWVWIGGHDVVTSRRGYVACRW